MFMLARRRRSHAQKLFAGRPRPHGRGRQDFGDLRILQRELRVRARRGRGQVELMTGIVRALLMALVVLIAPQAAQAENCPAAIDGAARPALVVAGNMQTSAAMLTLYSRERRGAPWQPLGAAQ